MNRRKFLALAGTVAAGAAAGCAGGGTGGTPTQAGTPTPAGSPTAAPTESPTSTPTATESPTPTATESPTPTPVAAQEKYAEYEWGQLTDADRVATDRIELSGFAFHPLVAVVSPGTAVTFANQDGAAHTVTIPKLRVNERLPGGASATVTFDRVGTYDYVCALHPPSMLGRVVVSEETPTPTPEPAMATVTTQGTSFEPLRLSIEPGTTVRWEHGGPQYGEAHTVTSAGFHDKAATWSFDERLGAGTAIERTFDAEGVYEYFCAIHGKASMCGAILVGDTSLEKDLPCEGAEDEDGDGDGGGYY